MVCVMALAAAMDISDGKEADSIELFDVTIGRPIPLGTSPVEIETPITIEAGNDGANSIQAVFSLNKRAAHDFRRPRVRIIILLQTTQAVRVEACEHQPIL
jgi:hypothetical protein